MRSLGGSRKRCGRRRKNRSRSHCGTSTSTSRGVSSPRLVEVEVPQWLRDRFFLRLPQRFLEPPSERIVAALLVLDRLLEQGLSMRFLLRENAARLRQFGLVAPFGFLV